MEILEDPDTDLSQINPLPSAHAFIDFLRRRALDDSVYVRKNALQVKLEFNLNQMNVFYDSVILSR